MSAIPSFVFNNIDAPRPEDQMDVAASPFLQDDDFDLDLDSVREPSVIEDEMIDYQAEDSDANAHRTNEPFDTNIPDDEMFDQASTAAIDLDYNMDSFVDRPEQEQDEDEEILYEDEDEQDQNQAQELQHVDDLAEPQPHPEQEEELASVDAQDDGISTEIQERSLGVDHQSATDGSDPTPNIHTATVEASTVLPEPTDLTVSHSDSLHDFLARSPSHHSADAIHDTDSKSELLSSAAPENLAVETVTRLNPEENYPVRADEDAHAVIDGSAETASAPTEDKSDRVHVEPPRDIHPVTLVYLEEEMSLFPPMLGDDSPVYFLSDPTLAREPLDKLLGACREILIGTLDHHDELVLDVPGLGLHISEDSKYAAQITLSDVLEVYLNLCHNDSSEQIQPLYCHLSSRVSLSSQYAYLSSAGAEGKTYSEIAADHIDTPLDESTHIEMSPRPQETEEKQSDVTNQVADDNEPASNEQTAISQEEPLIHQITKDEPQDWVSTKEVEDSISQEFSEQHSDDNQNEASTLPAPHHPESGEVEEHDVTHPQEVDDQEQPQEINAEEQPQEAADEDLDENQVYQTEQQAQDIETNSSHTVEAYEDDILERAEPVENEDLFNHVDQEVEDLLDEHVVDAYEDFIDEEMFAKDDIVLEEEDETPSLVAEEGDGQSLSGVDDQNPHDLSSALHDHPEKDNTSDVPVILGTYASAVPSPPVTPSKDKPQKRKAENEDDFDFLDFSTPEPKRRRPS